MSTNSRKPYPSDVSDEEWAFAAPHLALVREHAPQRRHDLREVFDALCWIVRTGAPWRYLPTNFPPWAAVHQQAQRTSVSALLVETQHWIRLGGGVFLCWLKWQTIRSRPTPVTGVADERGARHLTAFGSTCGLTLTNPVTNLSFAAVFAGVGVADESGGMAPASALVAGVFLGSCLWWLVVCNATGLLRGWLATGRLTAVNRISGAVIFCFGGVALVSAIL